MKLSKIRLLPEMQTLFPRPRNYDEIKADVAKRGIQVPLVISANNELICGYTRFKIAQELGIEDVSTNEPIEFASLNEMKRYAIKDNDLRRQMTDLERYEYVVKPLLEIEEEEAEKREKAGVKIEPCGQNDHRVGKSQDIVGEQVGWSGKKIQRLKNISEKAIPEAKELFNASELTQAAALELVKLDDDEQREIVEKYRDVKDIKKYIRQKEKQARREEFANKHQYLSTPDDFTLLFGDMIDECKTIPNNSIDLILTDPPYAQEYLHLWDELAIASQRMLKPSGWLITYSGSFHLSYVMNTLSNHLNYYWMLCLRHREGTQLIYPRNIIAEWKPILIFQKEPLLQQEQTIVDLIDFEKMDKHFHDWQQGNRAPAFLIENFSNQGDTILDPFAGSGTFPITAYQMNRKVIAMDDDEQNINIIKGLMNK